MQAMDDPELVKTITRIETKLDNFMSTQSDHESRIRELEKNDLGRILPFLVGLLSTIALGIGIYAAVDSGNAHSMRPEYSVVVNGQSYDSSNA